MKRAPMVLSISFVFLLISTFPGSAQQNWQPGMNPYYGLNLTSEQLARIQELRLAFQKEILSLTTHLQTQYVELRTMYLNEKDQTNIEAKIEEINQLEGELEKNFMAHQAQVRELLTDEQKVLFDRWGGLGLGWRGMGGMGFGMGYGRGMGWGMGPGWGRGWNRGWGRGMGARGPGIGYGRGMAWDSGPAWGKGWNRGPGMGRGYWCPWYRQGRFNWFRNWW